MRTEEESRAGADLPRSFQRPVNEGSGPRGGNPQYEIPVGDPPLVHGFGAGLGEVFGSLLGPNQGRIATGDDPLNHLRIGSEGWGHLG